MSYPNYGKQHGGRGLKAFVIVVCVLLVAALAASAFVLWRTTNHFTELPEFENSDEDLVGEVVDPDDPDVPDLDDDTSPSFDELPYFDLEWTSLSVPVPVSGSGSPLNSATISVISSEDLSKYDSGWTIKADESFYYYGMWHDVLGYEFGEEFVVSEYLSLSYESCESCTVNLLDYFPATCYVYFWISNGRDYSYGVCRVDCTLQVYDFDNYLYIGDTTVSFQCTEFGDSVHVGFNCIQPIGVTRELFFYYDGLNCYNCLYFGLLDFPFYNNSSDGSCLEYGDYLDTVFRDVYFDSFSFCTSSDKGLVDFIDVPESKICISSMAFCGSVSGAFYDTKLSYFDVEDGWRITANNTFYGGAQGLFVYLVGCIFNRLGAVVVPFLSSYRVGSYLSDETLSSFSLENIGSYYQTLSLSYNGHTVLSTSFSSFSDVFDYQLAYFSSFVYGSFDFSCSKDYSGFFGSDPSYLDDFCDCLSGLDIDSLPEFSLRDCFNDFFPDGDVSFTFKPYQGVRFSMSFKFYTAIGFF